jgi:hypothetical protein
VTDQPEIRSPAIDFRVRRRINYRRLFPQQEQSIMTDQEAELLRQLDAKTREIEQELASTLGLADLEVIRKEAEELIDHFEEADIDEFDPAKSAEEWLQRDRRIASTQMGRLLQERRELQEKILDLREDELGLGEDD